MGITPLMGPNRDAALLLHNTVHDTVDKHKASLRQLALPAGSKAANYTLAAKMVSDNRVNDL